MKTFDGVSLLARTSVGLALKTQLDGILPSDMAACEGSHRQEMRPVFFWSDVDDWSGARPHMRIAGYLLLALGGSLGGCQHYQPSPLRNAGDVLAPVDVAALSADAQKIDRPFLRPQPIDLTQPLTSNELAVIAVIENPDLRALRAAQGVNDAQVFAAGLLPDPTFTANFDKILSGPDPFNAFGGQIGFDLAQLRTRRVARASGEATKRKVRLDLAWAEWQTVGAARLQGARIVGLQAQLELARASADLAQTELEIAMRAAGRGDLAGGQVDSRRQALLDASDKLRTTENNLATARGELNKQLGLPPEQVLALAPFADPPVPPSRMALINRALTDRLDLQALRAGYEAAEAEVHKAVLLQFPNLSLTIATARDTANNYTLGPAIGFTLPLWNRGRGLIATTSATREQLKAEYDARLFQTRASIDAAMTSLANVKMQRQTLLAAMPALERYAADSERAARRGDLAPVTARAARQVVRDRQLALLQLEQQAAEQTIALELLSGGLSEGWAA